MQEIEASGKNVDEAIARALERLGLGRDAVEVEVLHPGRAGILGLGAEEALVRVRARQPLPPAPEEMAALAQEILEGLLARMDIAATVETTVVPPSPESPAYISLDVMGDNLGILIGRRGETLTSLQYIVNLMVGRRIKARAGVNVDVEGYRARRAESLQGLAQRMAERVRMTGEPMNLEPMPANERREIHLALRDNPHVVAHSVGDGDNRKVVIYPRPAGHTTA